MQKIDYSCKNNKKNIKEKHFNKFYMRQYIRKGPFVLFLRK